MADRQFYLYKI